MVDVHRSLFGDDLELIKFLQDQIRYLQPFVDGHLLIEAVEVVLLMAPATPPLLCYSRWFGLSNH